VLRFIDNALVDIPGFDLYVFEVGPAIEPTDLAISKDGESWIQIGKIAGGTAQIDLSPYAKPGEVFHVVRLTDLKSDCGGATPGADIDAVGAIGSAIQISLNAAVLFDFDRDVLKGGAKPALDSVATAVKKYPGSKVVIEGHTDNVGSADYNQKLSESRATAVRAYLVSKGLSSNRIQAHGYGKARPVASNETDEGRERNRRVEIVIVP
jgi:OmpA-OmpF porin, OOP family